MHRTIGYVGTIESETQGTHRIWFSLTAGPQNSEWVQRDGIRAWFSLEMEAPALEDRPIQVNLLLEAMRLGLQVRVVHGNGTLQHDQANDGFEVTGIRILRADMSFN